MSITTWLKKNTVVSIMGLLKTEDWPKKPDTEPNPYTDREQSAMMEATSDDERLLLRFFLGTGMREQEIAHAELSDIKDSYIQVQAKPQYGWSPKTAAGTRKIPLGDALLADLEARERVLRVGATQVLQCRGERLPSLQSAGVLLTLGSDKMAYVFDGILLVAGAGGKYQIAILIEEGIARISPVLRAINETRIHDRRQDRVSPVFI